MNFKQQNKLIELENKIAQVQPRRYSKKDKISEFLQLYPHICKLKLLGYTYKEMLVEVLNDYSEYKFTENDLKNLYSQLKRKALLKKYQGILVLSPNKDIPSYIINKTLSTEFGFSILHNTIANQKYAINLDEIHSIKNIEGKLYIKRFMYWYNLSDFSLVGEVNPITEILINDIQENFYILYKKLFAKIATDSMYF